MGFILRELIKERECVLPISFSIPKELININTCKEKVLAMPSSYETGYIFNKENDINYNVCNVIENLQRSYEENEKVYDSINGEGAYAERFRLSPVYGSEYDTTSEDDDYNYDDDSI